MNSILPPNLHFTENKNAESSKTDASDTRGVKGIGPASMKGA